MAQKITVELQDDLDGRPADETVRFGVDGAEYEIDPSKKNAAALRRKLAPFIEHSRKAGRGQRRRGGRTAFSRDRSGSIRAWAPRPGGWQPGPLVCLNSGLGVAGSWFFGEPLVIRRGES